MNKGFFLPKRIARNIPNVIKNAIDSQSLNIGLYFNKFVLWYQDNETMTSDPMLQVAFLQKIENNFKKTMNLLFGPDHRGEKSRKKESFKKSIVDDAVLRIPFRALPLELYKLSNQKMQNLFKDLNKLGYYIQASETKLGWRLIINMGAASIYETSLLFHRNYSIPIIPGSAVKGVANHYCLKQKNEGKISQEDYRKIFGDQKNKGAVIFFDAFPVIKENRDFVVLDVMNVHHREYYQDKSGNVQPGDWMMPVPLFFLAVEKGTSFKFAVASKKKELATKASELLLEAISKIGIGAKTSAGYGHFYSNYEI